MPWTGQMFAGSKRLSRVNSVKLLMLHTVRKIQEIDTV